MPGTKALNPAARGLDDSRVLQSRDVLWEAGRGGVEAFDLEQVCPVEAGSSNLDQ
jgi:hypothetical protein